MLIYEILWEVFILGTMSSLLVYELIKDTKLVRSFIGGKH